MKSHQQHVSIPDASAAVFARTWATSRILANAVPLLLALLSAAFPLDAQELVSPRRSLQDADAEPAQVELEHGMPRLHVLHLLGEPPMESLIGVLDRSRVTLDDGTELLFEQDSLIAVKSATAIQQIEDGRLSFTVDRTTVIYGEELALPQLNAPDGEERRAVNDSFYFTEGVDGNDGFDIHFTPSTPVCLLNDCSGCDSCMGVNCVTGCGDPNCDGSCGAGLYYPRWELFRFSADALFLSRLGGDFTIPLLDGSTAVQPEDLTHGLTAGVKSTLAVHLRDGQHVELGYLGAFDWSSDGNSSNLIPPANGVLSWNGTYDAKLNDYQINYLHRTWDSTWSLLCGVRYSEHEDEFSAAFAGQIAGPPLVNRNPLSISGQAQNRLLGIHVGTTGEWNCGPFLLFAAMKGGVFNNETRQFGPQYTGSIDLGSNPTSIPTFNRDGQEVSFMGDLEFTVLYPIAEQVAVRVGYQGLIVSDMVQVRRQLGSAAAGSPLHYHGIFAGLEIRQ